jgi:DNA-binding NarL/FixJ family response regulator
MNSQQQKPGKIKILIADDHPVVREGLKQIISKATDMVIGGEARHGQEVLDKIAADHWDVVVLDVNMPGKDGFEVLRQLRHDKPKLPVLVLSIHPEDQLGIRVFKEGASGFLNKDAVPQELADAIRTVHAGRKYVSPQLAEKLASSLQNFVQGPPHEFLSNREYRVLCMIAGGMSVQDIAAELAISQKTVRTYRARIFKKMNMKNIAELTRYAIEHRLQR